MNKLEKIIRQSSGANLIEQELPIPATIGEGLVFNVGEDEFITSATRNGKGKRELKCVITTFAGYCGGAQHYYCRCTSYIHNIDTKNPTRMIAGYLGGFEMPEENKSIEFDLMRPVTKEELESDEDRWYGYQSEDGIMLTQAFLSEEDIHKTIEELKTCFSDDWDIIVKDW